MIELDDDYTFGARLREERERLGLKVHELAHMAGRTDLNQKKYEAGEKPIPIDYLQALAVRSDVDVSYLVMGKAGS